MSRFGFASGDPGVVATLSELVALRHQARRIDLPDSRRGRTLRAGPYLSPFRGRGMDFEEVRVYQAGDDVRNIDWRVTARSGRPYSKVFREEREQPVWLLLDAGPSMRFGTRRAFKSVAAARAAGLLAWVAREAGDRVGGLVLSSEGLAELPPRLRAPHVVRLLEAMARATAAAGDRPACRSAACLARLRRAARAGSRVIVLSDFYDLDDEGRGHLAGLARRCEVACVLVHDPLEVAPPPPGRYRITDGRAATSLVSSGRRWEDWALPFRNRLAALRELCGRHRIQLLPLRTDEDPAAALSRLPGSSRARRTRAHAEVAP